MSYRLLFMDRHGVVHLEESANHVTVGVAAALPDDTRRLLTAYHGKRIEQVRMAPDELRSRIQLCAAGAPPEGPERAGPGGNSGYDGPGGAGGYQSSLSITEIDPDAPAVNVVNALIGDGVRLHASDLHLSCARDSAAVRYRIDGHLHGSPDIPRHHFVSISARLKVLAGLNPAERRRAQDGRFTATVDNDTLDIRLSSMPTVGGESIVLRLFPRSGNVFSLDDIGLSDAALAEIRDAIERPSGLLFVAGPTGSGKTTTLHACLRHLANGERKIVTIEDPVEYHLPGIDQIQTNESVGLTFDSILKRVLRQDPNVIMVGEVRDAPTAGLVVRAAVTGHLVLSTVHARNGSAVNQRLVGLGVQAEALESLEPLVVEQRLVRVRCRRCEARGCPACRQTGFSGRTGVFGISRGEHGTTSMAADGLRKVVAGITTHEELAWATLT